MGVIMGLIRALFLRGGAEELGRVGVEVVDAIRPNATRQMQLGHDAYSAAQAGYAAEFTSRGGGWFDTLVNGLNRLPRPVLALATPGLFGYAMVDPAGFSVRMRGLAEVPEPLWWLLGAVVAFYFGARETHYLRARGGSQPLGAPPPAAEPPQPRDTARSNPALADWMSRDRSGEGPE